MKHDYVIKGMHCGSCTDKVATAIKAVTAVKNVSVQLNPPEAIIEMDEHISIERFNDALQLVGDYSMIEKSHGVDKKNIREEMLLSSEKKQTFRPLFIILAYIVGGTIFIAIMTNDFSSYSLMRNFMGGFFILFSLFKIIDLHGFVEGFQSYDLLAQKWKPYAFIYPFLELVLGMLYFANIFPTITNIFTLIIMLIGTLGVAQALLQKRAIQCACLGTIFKLPMTKVTLAEDLLMGIMALMMLF
jgi:copper chaperone CopZ